MNFEQWLQSRLTAHGYPVGVIDGKIETITIAALKAFQKARGLEVTGTANGTTVSHLRMPASTVPPEKLVGVPDRNEDRTLPEISARNPWPRQVDCMRFYGPVGTSQVMVELPFSMMLAWDKSTRVRKISLHSKVAASAARVFNQIAEIYTEAERASLGLNIFGGSLNVRRMRGGTAYSMHSWGIALDFDPERNGLNVKAPQARLSHADAVPFWEAWEAEGWLSLGRGRGYDFMHVQAARL